MKETENRDMGKVNKRENKMQLQTCEKSNKRRIQSKISPEIDTHQFFSRSS